MPMLQHLTLFGDKLPPDVQVRSHRAHEGISRPYAIDVEIMWYNKSTKTVETAYPPAAYARAQAEAARSKRRGE